MTNELNSSLDESWGSGHRYRTPEQFPAPVRSTEAIRLSSYLGPYKGRLMNPNTTTSIYIWVVFGFAVAASLWLIGGALYSGLKGRHDLVYWRIIKLMSALLGLVGLILLLLNFEKTVRDAIGGKSRDYAYAEFIDLKFWIAREVASACAHEKESKQAELTCFDLKNIDNIVSSWNVRHSTPYDPIKNWQHNPDIDGFIKEVNSRLSILNTSIPASAVAGSFLSDDGRFSLLMFSIFLVIAGLAGSIGEAAFQLTQAIQAARDRRGAASSTAAPNPTQQGSTTTTRPPSNNA